MSEQNEKNLDKMGAPKMELGMAMDLAEAATKGKSKKERSELNQEVAAEKNKDSKEKNRLTPQQKEIVDKLNSVQGSEKRVKMFATIADDIGLDPLLSLIPELGDAGSSVVSGLYLLYEAKKAGLGMSSYVKIIGLQVADFFVGAIPVVGDIADYFFKANHLSASSFQKKTQELIKEARKAGVPEEEINKITQSADKLPNMVSHAVNLYKTVGGGKK